MLLQQTRVAQAVPYFERFTRRFPTLRSLAQASQEEVLKVWEGAGYYARARHLHQAAVLIAKEQGGRIPSTVPELERLPGVGPYIARAIASQAFGVAVPALESNGLRIVARWTREAHDVRVPKVRATLEAVLSRELPVSRPGAYNEAVMELGETICTLRAPRCRECPVSSLCATYRAGVDPETLPKRAPKPRRPLVRTSVIVLHHRGGILLQRRPPRGLLGGLWELPGAERRKGELPEQAVRRELREEIGITVGKVRFRGVVRHSYSHFHVELRILEGDVAGSPPPLAGHRRWVSPRELTRLPLPRATTRVLETIRMAGTRRRPSGERTDRAQRAADRSHP